MTTISDLDSRLRDWISNGEHGMSCLTIAYVLSPYPVPFQWGPHLPLDPDDYRRCRELLIAIPEWRSRLPEVAERYPMWIPYVREWDRIEEAFQRPIRDKFGILHYTECYAIMDSLKDESRIRDGWIPEHVGRTHVSQWHRVERTVPEDEVRRWLDWIAAQKRRAQGESR